MHLRRRAVVRPLGLVLAAPLLLTACGGGGPSLGAAGSSTGSSTGSTPTTTSSSASSSSGAAASSSTSSGAAASSAADWGHLAGCPSVGRAVPSGTHSAPTVDVDGDGRADTEFIGTGPDAQGGVPFGARTASGGVFSASISSASPVARSVVFADVTGHGEVIALASDGRSVSLWAVSECQLVPVQNPQGQQYAFDLGFTGFGTGVGCADADGDGVPELLGLKLDTDASGHPTQVERTIIRLDGAHASNGARSTVPVTSDQQARLAGQVTCGDLTMAANGVSSNP